jgi:multidrug efflux system outer membrane protein
MRQALGTSVFSGMLGVTFFGLALTPVFYVAIRWFIERKHARPERQHEKQPVAQTTHIMLILVLVPGLLGLANGCKAVGPDYSEPAVPVPAEFANQEGLRPAPTQSRQQPGMTTTAVEVAWWRGFQDEELNQLVEETLNNNHDIRIATARLQEARALLSVAEFDRYPTVTTEESYTHQRLSKVAARGVADRDTDLFHAGFDASWELDFFGRVRRAIEAGTADVGAAEASRRDVMVSLLAEVASNYFDLRGAQNQLAVARQNAETLQQTLELTQALLAAGRGTELDVSRAEAQLNATLATIPPLETRIARDSHRLGVLIGQQPTALVTTLSAPLPLPGLPTLIALGKPADLLRRRPDIRIAERNLAAATARIGVATADLFPRITVLGSVGVEAGSLKGFGQGGIDTFSLGPSIFWAAFDLGRVRARIRAADARTEAALAQYEQRVLLALEETENSLVDFQRQQARRDLLRASTQASEKAAGLAKLRYQFGVSDFLTVLDAERTRLIAEDLLADSETRTALSLIAVYKALGGGWEHRG